MMTLGEKAAKIRAFIVDIDGVMTDGRVGYGKDDEIKFFHVRDGHGLKLASRAGLKIGALSGRQAQANRRRADELGFDFLYENAKNKRETFERLLADNGLKAEECLYIGDDVIDIPVLRQAGIGVTVADAPDYVSEYCDFKTEARGGHGAVREVTDWIIKEQGKWDLVMERYVS